MAILGYGSGLTGDNVTNIGEITDIGFNLSAESADTTSSVSQYSSGVPTTIKSNTIFLSALYDGSNGGDVFQFVREFKAKRIGTWRVTFPTGYFQCSGYVSTVTVAAPHDHIIRMDITITLTGEPVFA